MLLCLLAKEARKKKGECGALLVKGQINNPRNRLRPLPAAPLVARLRYLPRPSPAAQPPAAPLDVRCRYLIVVPRPSRPLLRCASQVRDRGAQAAARGAAQVLDRGAQAAARGAARCAP
jgi:hypothetical protein